MKGIKTKWKNYIEKWTSVRMFIQKIHPRFWIFNLYCDWNFHSLKKKKKPQSCSFMIGHFMTWWAFVWRKNLWSCMASKKKFSPISFFRLHNKANGCERETQRENLNIERWVCACFYTCFTVVLSRSRSNGFRLVLPIPKAWVFNVLLISSH